jgi:hypothetical protein
MISAVVALAAVLTGFPSATGAPVGPAAQATTGAVIIEVDYLAGGTSFTWQAPKGCSASTADVDYEVPDVDLTIVSYRNYSWCEATHYALPNFQDPIDPGTPGPHRVRSIRWT